MRLACEGRQEAQTHGDSGAVLARSRVGYAGHVGVTQEQLTHQDPIHYYVLYRDLQQLQNTKREGWQSAPGTNHGTWLTQHTGGTLLVGPRVDEMENRTAHGESIS